ncbi:MAG: hypothetical protein ACYCUM_06910 [Solirubrobacteraceae bacterium]
MRLSADAELRRERRLHVDLAEHAEAVARELGADALQRPLER